MNTSILSNENKNIYKKLDNNLLNSGQPINCVGENITNIIPYFNLQFFDVFWSICINHTSQLIPQIDVQRG